MKKDKIIERYSSYEDIPLFLDANDVVKVLGLSRSNVYEMMRANDFPALVIGGRKMVRKEKLFAWLDSRETPPHETVVLTKSTSSTF